MTNTYVFKMDGNTNVLTMRDSAAAFRASGNDTYASILYSIIGTAIEMCEDEEHFTALINDKATWEKAAEIQFSKIGIRSMTAEIMGIYSEILDTIAEAEGIAVYID